MKPNRRRFMETSLAAGSIAALKASTYAQVAGANQRVNVGVIGPGGMGKNHIRTLMTQNDVHILHVCDVDQTRLDEAVKLSTREKQPAPQSTKDLRQVLANRDIQAVFIATPDHWHAPASILALNEGKHVYVEKPCSHNIREGRLMIEAARNRKLVCQVGTQTRSSDHVKNAVRAMSENEIGEVLSVRVWNSQLRRDIGKQKPTPVPNGLDYDTWVGPAPFVPYQQNRLHSSWRWFFNFGAGDMGNDGVHDLDVGMWGLGVDTHPTTITALGGKYFFDDDQEFPDTQTVVFEWPSVGKNSRKKQLIFEQRIWTPYKMEGHENGDAYYGTTGMIVLGKGTGWTMYGPRNKEIRSQQGSPNLPGHHRNFFDCIRTGARPNADIEINHLSTTLCHLGNIATRLRRTLTFDPRKEDFIGDREASALVSRQYRDHWATPKGV